MDLRLDDPSYSLFEAIDRPRGTRFTGPPRERMTFRQCLDGIDVTVRELAQMEAQCKERLRRLRDMHGRLPKFGTDDYRKLREQDPQRQDPRWRTSTAEADWQRANAELRAFQGDPRDSKFESLRRWYREQCDAGKGDRLVPMYGSSQSEPAPPPEAKPHWSDREPGSDDFEERR